MVMNHVSLFGADLSNADIRGSLNKVYYNTKPIKIGDTLRPPTKFSNIPTKTTGKAFQPQTVKGMIDVSIHGRP